MAENTEVVRQAASDLIQGWSNSRDGSVTPPTPLQLFQLGRILHQLHALPGETATHQIESAYHGLLEATPKAYRTHLLDALHQGLRTLLHQHQQEQSASADNHEAALSALQSLEALHRFSTLAQASPEAISQTLPVLAVFYERIVPDPSTQRQQTLILSLMVLLLWTSPSTTSLAWEDLLPVLDTLQQVGVWKPLVGYLDERTGAEWQARWLDGIAADDETHRDYLTQWLQASTQDEEALTSQALSTAIAQTEPVRRTTSSGDRKPAAVVDPLQFSMDQVRAIFPQFGEGFVEVALSLTRNNMDETVALLAGEPTEWPAALRTVDPSLPRRHQRQVAVVDAEARQRTKEAIRAADQQQERDAMILEQFTTTTDEYNDDYDDQWDETDAAGAANDGGLYDDYKTVITYNRVVRDSEKEAAFWNDSANTNRSSGGAGGNGQTRFRGPDKIKGGRIPKPLTATASGSDGKQKKKEPEAKGGSQSNKKQSDGKKNSAPQKEATTESKPSRAAQRQKDRKLGNRREKQKDAMNKRGV
jgi:rubrerythrin